MKYFYYLVGALVFVFVTNWTFNHVSAWLAIFMIIAAVGFVINAVIKFLKNN